MPTIVFLRPIYLIVTALAATVGGWYASTVILSQFEMRLETSTATVPVEETFTVAVVVQSEEPTNVFSGTVRFDPNYFLVEKIDYNTSIADLWAVEPWYSNGDGTVTFAGGTTRAGGYVGNETLLTITFKAINTGQTRLGFDEVMILKHDGLGTIANSETPIDVIFTIEPSVLAKEIVLQKSGLGPEVAIVENQPDVDLNGDGQVSTTDYSIFMVHLATQNNRSDFNGDGRVTLSDLSILSRLK